jgi:hypothetical protein
MKRTPSKRPKPSSVPSTAEHGRLYSYDGHGINGPDQYRTRIASFSSACTGADRERYGKLFAGAEGMYHAIEHLVHSQQFDKLSEVTRIMLLTALYTAELPGTLLTEFTDAYIEACLWSTPTGLPDGPEYMSSYSGGLDDACLPNATHTCRSFLEANLGLVVTALERGALVPSLGRALWLSSAGHGCGFIDLKNLQGSVGKELHLKAKSWFCDVWIDEDDGKIHIARRSA